LTASASKDQGAPRRTRTRHGPIAMAAAVLAILVLSLSLWGNDAHAQGGLFFGLWRTRSFVLAIALVWVAVIVAVHRSSKRVAKGLVVSSAVMAVTLVALEAVGYAARIDWKAALAGGPALTLGKSAVPHAEGEGLAAQDIAFLSGIEFERIPYRFRADQFGFRNAVDRDSADVYLLGDSFIVGGLVPGDELLSARLEQDAHVTVMNVALSGLSPQEERELLLRSKLPLDGRLVVHFVFEGNDLLDSKRSTLGGSRDAEPKPSVAERSLTFALMLELQRASQRLVGRRSGNYGLINGRPFLFRWLRSSFFGVEDQCAEITGTLLDLKQRVEQQGGRYCVVSIPSKMRVLGPACTFPADSDLSDVESNIGPLPASLAAWAAAKGVDYLDLAPALSESMTAGRIPWFPADTHWNGIGHETAARALAAWGPVQGFLRAGPGRTTR
jgi:hypothetical protein